MRGFRLTICILALAVSPNLFGGEVTFKNGDRLTGTVTVADENKITIDSKVAGKITVDLSDVASFSTDAPVKATLTSGAVIKAPLTTAANTSTAPAPVQSVPRDQIAKIAPATLAQPWKGDVLLGATVQSGNTRSTQFAGSADAVRRWEDSRLTLLGQYIYGRQHTDGTQITTAMGKHITVDEKQTTSDYGAASAKYDYFLTKKVYAYGLLSAQHDGVAGLDIRITPSAGIGYQWHESPKWNFSTEAGGGWTYEDYSPGGVDEYVSARLAYHYDRKLAKNLLFINNFEYLPDVQDLGRFVINADAGIHADVSTKMFTEFKVQWTHDSKPAPGSVEDDLRFLASLGWHF